MTPEALGRAEVAILGGASLDAVCEAVGASRKALERAWRKAHGVSPGRWRRQVLGIARCSSRPDVAFRLSPLAAAELARRAEAAGVSASEYARTLVLEALGRGR